MRQSPGKGPAVFCRSLQHILDTLDDGITALASAPDSSLYIACWNSLLKITKDGQVKELVHPVKVPDCDEDPADHKEANRGLPLLRGIAADDAGALYAAATSCHCVLRQGPDGKTTTLLKTERPWSPTGIALHGGDVYVLEYTNANGPATEGWIPRVQKITKDGRVTTITPDTLR
jgi:hypothetical protein